MPDPYQNPDTKPYVGNLSWVPSNANGNSSGFGFFTTDIERGKFRNDVANDTQNTVTITISKGTVVSSSGSEKWPIMAAFRPLQNPNINYIPPVSTFQMTADNNGDMIYQIDIASGNKRLSSITLFYDLTIDIKDQNIKSFLTPDDQIIYQKFIDGKIPSLNIDFTQYNWGIVQTISGTTVTEWPKVGIGTSSNQELKLTGTEQIDSSGNIIEPAKKREITIRFGDDNSHRTTDFTTNFDSIRIINRHPISSLRLYLKKIMLFEAQEINIDYRQTPCSHLEYCSLVNFDYSPLTQSSTVPSGNSPNLHIKVFSPNNQFYDGTSGFAHSLSLRFFIFSLPIYGLTGDFSNIIGALDAANNPNAFYTVFVGPIANTRALLLLNSNNFISNSSSRIIRLDHDSIQSNTIKITAQRAINYSSTDPPDVNNISWEDLGVFDPLNMPSPDINATTGYVDNYVLADVSPKNNMWYRITQTYNNQLVVSGAPFLSESYYAKNIATLYQNASQSSGGQIPSFDIINRIKINDLNTTISQINPFAVFAMPLDLSLANPITIIKGFWNLRFNVSCTDNTYTNTHVFARIWFVPDNPSTAVQNANQLQFQQNTEIIFEYDAVNQTTKLIFGKAPTSFNNVFMTPPISTSKTEFILRKYADTVEKNGKIINNGILNLPYSDTVKGSLVIGFYLYSYITDDGVQQLKRENKTLTNTSPVIPVVTFRCDGVNDGLESTIRITQSQVFSLERASKYDTSTYVNYINNTDFPNGLYLSRNQYNVGLLPAVPNEPSQKYTNIFKSNNSNAFDGLLTLIGTASTADIIIPYTTISLIKDYKTIKFADFITLGPSLGLGQVSIGNWQIQAKIFNDSIQEAAIISEYRIEGFLATADGVVVGRIFRTIWTPTSSTSGDNFLLEWNFNITIPFQIPSGNVQMILRLSSAPYSKNGVPVDLSKLATNMSTPTSKRYVGAWIRELRIISSSLQKNIIVQNVFTPGSPAYYEDLPLNPGSSLGSNDFWFVAADDLQKINITFADKPLNITGALYSPVWRHFLPKDVEVNYAIDPQIKTNGDKLLRFRTVPTIGGKEQAFISLSAKEDDVIGSISIVTENSADQVTTLSNTSNITYYQQNTPTAGLNNDPIGLYDIANNPVNLNAIDVVWRKEKGEFYVIGNVITGDVLTAIIQNRSYGQNNKFENIGRNSDIDFVNPSLLASGLTLISTTQSPVSKVLYIAGWVDPGAIVVKTAEPYQSSGDIVVQGSYFVVDGNINQLALAPDSLITFPFGELFGHAIKDFPGITVTENGLICVAYTLEEQIATLRMRTAFENRAFNSQSFNIVSFGEFGITANDNLNIFSPVLYYHYGTRIVYVAFWCGGKIFGTMLSGVGQEEGVLLRSLTLIAGNRNFDSNSNAANPFFKILQSQNNIVVNQKGDLEDDVPQQRCGFFVGEHSGFSGLLYIYYIDAQNNLCTRQVSEAFKVDEKLILSTILT